MPNVAPRAVWIRDLSGTRRQPVMFHLLDATAVQRTAVRVWEWDPTLNAGAGGWAVAWAAVASPPTSVTISYTSSPTQVNVSWVHPSPRAADQWRIYRPDGTVAGTVSYAATTFTDSDPKPLNGAYTVKGVLAGVEGPATTSNTLDLRLQAATLTATWNASNQRVEFGGTANAVGYGDSWNYYRGDNSYVGSNVAAAPTGWDTIGTGSLRGSQQTYKVRAVLSGVESALERSSSTVNIPPNVSQPQSLAVLNYSLGMRFGFWGPSAGSVTNYEVETWQNGVWTNRGVGHTSGQYDWTAADTSPVYARVRTIAPGGVSDWAQIGPATPINDTTPPAAPTLHSFKPEASYGRLVARVTTSGDTTGMCLQRSINSGGWENVWCSGVSGGQYVAVDMGTFGAGTNVQLRAAVHDALGNWGYYVLASWTLRTSPIVLLADGTNNWTYPGYNAADKRPKQGYLVDPNTYSIGMWYYNTNIELETAGYDVWGAVMAIRRVNDDGVGGSREVYMRCHNETTDPGTLSPVVPPVLSEASFYFGTFVNGQTIEQWLPESFLNALRTGVHRGLAIYGGPFAIFDSKDENALSGVLSFHHLG